MRPLLNLKSFLAVLMILIVPAALLVAYFRNYSPEGGGHEHSGAVTSGKGDDNSAMKPGHNMSAMQTGGDKSAMQPGHDMSAMQPGSDKSAMQRSHDMSAMQTGHDKSATQGGDMSAMAKSSALPGVPGVSRLYHIGATGFFLNHPEHITLSMNQQAALNVVKQKALLSKSTSQRQIEEAEQELWELTGADEPDAAQIQAKVQTIEKLRGEHRLAFIQSVGEAAKVLTEEQRQMLLGTTGPADSRVKTPVSK